MLKLNKMDFADRLKELRKRKGISQGDLAELIEVHFTQVSRYERGETKPNAEAMTKLAKALDTSVDYLMNGTADDVVQDAGLEKELKIIGHMENTMVIQLTNQKAAGLLHELEELHLIKVLKENIEPVKTKLSDKYKGFISKEEGQQLNDQIKQMRGEWNGI